MRKAAASIQVISIPIQQWQAEQCNTKCTESLTMLLYFAQGRNNSYRLRWNRIWGWVSSGKSKGEKSISEEIKMQRRCLSISKDSGQQQSSKLRSLPCCQDDKGNTGFVPSSSVQFSHSVVSNSLQPHGLQYARLPCPSPSHRACSNSCPLSQWCHPTISSSVTSFSSYPQSFPASESFPMSWLFILGGQRTDALASASVLPINIQGWFPLGLTDLISLLSKGLSRALSSTKIQKHQFFGTQQAFFLVLFSHT